MAEDFQEARRAVENWHLGQTSAHYESSGRGAGVISTGKGDNGGVSYGAYQLSSKKGTLREYLDQSHYGEQFKGLTPATPAFDAKWKGLAATDPGFSKDQHDFIGRSHYGEQRDALRSLGVDLSGRGRAVQDALWSTSVQFRGLTPRIFTQGLTEKFGQNYQLSRLSDKDIVEAVQDYKIAHNATLFKSSPELHPGLLRRANAEKAGLVHLATQEEVLKGNGVDIASSIEAPEAKVARRPSPALPAQSPKDVLKLGEQSEDARALQRNLNRLGYSDAHGRSLRSDGDFGARTEEAVRAFQRAHGLHVDGVVGDNTRAALAKAERTPLLSERTHPDNPMFQQVRNGLKELHGAPRSEAELDRVSAAVATAAKQAGIRHIDHVMMNTRGDSVIAVQGNLQDPAKTFVAVDKAQAAGQSLEQSTAHLAEHMANRQQQSAQHTQMEHMEHRAGLTVGMRP